MKNFLILILTWFTGWLTINAQTDYTARYINLGHQSAALYESTQKSEKSTVGIVVMHSHQDYMNFIANSELAKRGYTVIATNPGSSDLIENKVISIQACVDYLRNRGDIRKVILLGHSGGGTVMSAYQNLAENGRKALNDKLYQDYSDKINNLPPADGVMLFDANPGLSTVMLNSLDPNVTDESTGFNLSGKYTYDKEKEYMQGQQERYNRLVKEAQERLELIKAGKGRFADDEPFVIPGSNSIRFFNKLYSSDLTLLNHTKGKWPLIHPDGSITTQVVFSVRAPFKPMDKTEMLGTAQSLTVRSFLSSYAMTVDKDYEVLPDGFKGIRFDSNLTSPIGNVKGIHVPSLFMGMTGSYEYITSESIFNNSPATDKTLIFVEGASHMFTPDKKAEEYNNVKYGDTVKNMFDFVDLWLNERFNKPMD